MDLNKIMEFDHVITVGADGTVSDGPAGVYAPEVWSADSYAAGREADIEDGQGWALMRGYTGQYASAGSPWMHASEYIGGRMARDILETPGLYVAIADLDGDSWAVAYREAA